MRGYGPARLIQQAVPLATIEAAVRDSLAFVRRWLPDA